MSGKFIIDLARYKAQDSRVYTGRTQGESVRRELKLSSIEKDNDEIEILIPEETASLNPSFFLGLLYDSIKALGIENFRTKYHIIFQTKNEELKRTLARNIEDGFRNAENSIKNNLNSIIN